MASFDRAPEPMHPPNTSTVPLRLVLAAPTFHPFYSGASERFRRYFPGFRERGIEPLVLTGTPQREKAILAGVEPWWEEEPVGRLLPPEEVDGVRVLRVRLPERGGRRRSAAFAQALSEYCLSPATSPHLVQLYTPAVTALPWLSRIARAGIPLVAARTMMPQRSRNPLVQVARRTSHRMAAVPVACDIVGTKSMARAYRSLGIRHRVEVIPHGVDLDRFRPAADPGEKVALRRKLGLPERSEVLLFVGAMTPRKRVHLLVDAWTRLTRHRPDLHLALVGPGWPEDPGAGLGYGTHLLEAADGAAAPGRLHRPGEVEEVEDYYRAADLFVFPSSREGMPNAMVEAMASGLPVLTTRFLGLSAELGDPGDTFVPLEADPSSLAEAVAALLGDPSARARYGAAGRNWCERHLSLDAVMQRYADTYRTLADFGPAGS